MDRTPLLTPAEVAGLLGKRRPDYVYERIAAGDLAAVNLADDPSGDKPTWGISHEALDEFIARRTRQTSSAPAVRNQEKKPSGYARARKAAVSLE